MNVVIVIGAVLATALAFFTYIVFQRTSITMNLDIFIKSEPQEIFNFLKDPKHLPDIDTRVKSAVLQREMKNPDGTELREIITREEFRHIGIQTVSIWSSANPDQQVIYLTSMSLYALIRSHVVFNFKPFQFRGSDGTLVTESIDIHIPYALNNFVNKTAFESHRNMLDNLKFILERTYNIDKDLNGEFEHSYNKKIKYPDEIKPPKYYKEEEEEDLDSEFSDQYEEDSWDLFHKG